jgi:hypothetical protein
MSGGRHTDTAVSVCTPRNRRQLAAEQGAAWAVLRSDRRFLWLYAGLAAACSLAGNLGHAWVTRASGPPPLWMLYGWATVPVVLLVLAAYAKPTMTRMLAMSRGAAADDAERDRLSSVVVWSVFAGAFAWSAHGIYLFTAALGVPVSVAWIAPATIDVALFGALRGLVLTAPIAARIKEGLEPVPAQTASAAPARPRPVAAPAAAPAALTAPRAAPTAVEPAPAALAAPPSGAAVDAAAARIVAAGAVEEVAARIAASSATTQPSEMVAAIITARAAGELKGPLARRLGIHHSAVQNVMDAAAAEPAPRSLTAV